MFPFRLVAMLINAHAIGRGSFSDRSFSMWISFECHPDGTDLYGVVVRQDQPGRLPVEYDAYAFERTDQQLAYQRKLRSA